MVYFWASYYFCISLYCDYRRYGTHPTAKPSYYAPYMQAPYPTYHQYPTTPSYHPPEYYDSYGTPQAEPLTFKPVTEKFEENFFAPITPNSMLSSLSVPDSNTIRIGSMPFNGKIPTSSASPPILNPTILVTSLPERLQAVMYKLVSREIIPFETPDSVLLVQRRPPRNNS